MRPPCVRRILSNARASAEFAHTFFVERGRFPNLANLAKNTSAFAEQVCLQSEVLAVLKIATNADTTVENTYTVKSA